MGVIYILFIISLTVVPRLLAKDLEDLHRNVFRRCDNHTQDWESPDQTGSLNTSNPTSTLSFSDPEVSAGATTDLSIPSTPSPTICLGYGGVPCDQWNSSTSQSPPYPLNGTASQSLINATTTEGINIHSGSIISTTGSLVSIVSNTNVTLTGSLSTTTTESGVNSGATAISNSSNPFGGTNTSYIPSNSSSTSYTVPTNGSGNNTNCSGTECPPAPTSLPNTNRTSSVGPEQNNTAVGEGDRSIPPFLNTTRPNRPVPAAVTATVSTISTWSLPSNSITYTNTSSVTATSPSPENNTISLSSNPSSGANASLSSVASLTTQLPSNISESTQSSTGTASAESSGISGSTEGSSNSITSLTSSNNSTVTLNSGSSSITSESSSTNTGQSIFRSVSSNATKSQTCTETGINGTGIFPNATGVTVASTALRTSEVRPTNTGSATSTTDINGIVSTATPSSPTIVSNQSPSSTRKSVTTDSATSHESSISITTLTDATATVCVGTDSAGSLATTDCSFLAALNGGARARPTGEGSNTDTGVETGVGTATSTKPTTFVTSFTSANITYSAPSAGFAYVTKRNLMREKNQF